MLSNFPSQKTRDRPSPFRPYYYYYYVTLAVYRHKAYSVRNVKCPCVFTSNDMQYNLLHMPHIILLARIEAARASAALFKYHILRQSTAHRAGRNTPDGVTPGNRCAVVLCVTGRRRLLHIQSHDKPIQSPALHTCRSRVFSVCVFFRVCSTINCYGKYCAR